MLAGYKSTLNRSNFETAAPFAASGQPGKYQFKYYGIRSFDYDEQH
jgi:hypothetical protein